MEKIHRLGARTVDRGAKKSHFTGHRELKQLSWLEFTLINYSESSDYLLLIFIVKITHLIKANQRKSLS